MEKLPLMRSGTNLFLLFILTLSSARAQPHRKILLVFSGSDWCQPCIRFEKKVLRDTAFRQLAQERLIVLEADFPQHKKIPDSLRIQYEALAQRFNPEGVFPRILLLDADRHLLAELVYADQPAAQFIRQLKEALKEDP